MLLEYLEIDAADGQRLRVAYAGSDQNEMVLLLHGYPDSHRVWREVMQALAGDYFVVSYDLRGVGGSGPPAPPKTYRIEVLITDVDRVIRAMNYEQAHLVGHDWGSTIGWAFVTDDRYAPMVRSWTTISGPHLGIWQRWLADQLRSGDPRRLLAAARQLLKSVYVIYLLAWPLPDLVWRVGGVALWRAVLRRAGVPTEDPLLDESREQVLSMVLRPMHLYRQNLLRRHSAPPPRSIDCPVQLILATRDPFVSEASLDNLSQYANNLTIKRLDASHWVPRSHGQEIVGLLQAFLVASDRGDPPGSQSP